MSVLDLWPREITPAVTMPADATVEQATSLMSFAGLPAVILVRAEGHTVGVLGRSELVKVIAGTAHHRPALADASLGMSDYPQIDCEASPVAVLRLALASDCETVMLTRGGQAVGFLDLIDVLEATRDAPPH